MATILLSTNSLSKRETNQMLDKIPHVRRGVQHSTYGGELKTTGYDSHRYLELYVPEQSVDGILNFLRGDALYKKTVIDGWEEFRDNSTLVQARFAEAAAQEAQKKTPEINEITPPAQGTALEGITDTIIDAILPKNWTPA